MLIVGFIAGVIMGPQIQFAQPEDIDLKNLSLKDIPKLVSYEAEEETPDKKVVTKVLNGNTFLIEGGKEVRLLGVEVDDEGQPCYKEAKDRLTQLVSGKTVTLEETARNKDDSGRLLRIVKLGDLDVNKTLLKEGAAVVYFSKADELNKDSYTAAEKFARENEIGCKWRNGEEETSDN